MHTCTSKSKKGGELTIKNETGSDIFVIDKFSFDSEPEDRPLQIFDFGYENENTNKLRPYLKPEYIPMYTDKTIFLSIEDYHKNYLYGSLIYYIIKKENLIKLKRDILKEKLFQVIKIDLKKYNEKDDNNYLYYNNDTILYKNY